jgi:hypothetical protein
MRRIRVADRVDSGRLGVGPDVVDIGGEPVRKPIEEDIDTQGVEIKAERLEPTVLGFDLVHPVPNGIISMNSVVDEAAAQRKGVLTVWGSIRLLESVVDGGSSTNVGRRVFLGGGRGDLERGDDQVKMGGKDWRGGWLKDKASELAVSFAPGRLRSFGRWRIGLDELACLDHQKGKLEPLVPFDEVLFPVSLGISVKILPRLLSDILTIGGGERANKRKVAWSRAGVTRGWRTVEGC